MTLATLIPVHIITGFLGSGKTTFIQQILSNNQNHQTLVMINEFGEIGLDHLLIEPVSDNTYLLPSGCMCCTVLTDIKHTLVEILRELKTGQMPYFDKVIIETTGLANPAAILSLFNHDVHLKNHFSVHGLTTVVDSEFALSQAHTQPEWLAQITACQQIVLSKTDRIDHAQLPALQAYLNTLNPDASFVDRAILSDVHALFAKDLSFISSLNPRFFQAVEQQKHQAVQSIVLEYDKAIDWAVFGLWLSLLLNQYGEHILRIKGMLYLDNVDQPIFIHGVQHCLYPPEHLSKPLWSKQVSKLVFICRGIDCQQIRHSADTFLGSIGCMKIASA
ncbi:GTP-binding protein [Moraxella nasovis]|uniref:CobW family GTP-binding protein n=1 Tax=Moraxella nasovis TaxID=2904121 RepID=UPI001F600BE7|nr:GTP-binding protein [Moraxella nasovis]UNU73847.1 GTP-binding protein [Moraxella nasovis]